MEMSGICGLCRTEIDADAHRAGCVDLCDYCFGGDIVERMRHERGFELIEKSWVEKSNNENGGTWVHTQVTGKVALPVSLSAHFSREGLGTRIRKFLGVLRDEVQAGDELFDDAVLVETTTDDATRRALHSEGLQMVILDAISEYNAIRFRAVSDGCEVTVASAQGSKSREPAKTGHQRTVALALHHLEDALAPR